MINGVPGPPLAAPSLPIKDALPQPLLRCCAKTGRFLQM